MEDELLPPRERADQAGRTDIEARLRATMGEGALSHGWIIAGPQGSGKATLAYRIARGMLDPAALTDPASFNVPETSRVFRLVASEAHPDLFVAKREWDEKKSKYQSEITIETIRKLTSFLNRTASGGGWRVAIIDTADDMNRNAANALLKALEEPPSKTLLLLLSAAPGRLIPTIRSRCRRIELPPLSDGEVEAFLKAEGVKKSEAKEIAAFCRGRPGYALKLAMGEGGEAIDLTRAFFEAVLGGGEISSIAAALSGKAGDARWEIFREAVVDELSDAARKNASDRTSDVFASASPASLLSAWEAASTLIARGEALNLDRAQLVRALAYDIRNALRGEAA